jgi:hypothetical protein
MHRGQSVSAHRFRHAIGTQLAEGGAQIQIIMAIVWYFSDRVHLEKIEQLIHQG